jgi:hypothetical protein
MVADVEADNARRELTKAGWEFFPGATWPSSVAAHVIAAGHAGVLEYIGHADDHRHTITRYCTHGVWRYEPRFSLPWAREKQIRQLEATCPCPLRMLVSEFYPASSADGLRRTWRPEMRAWLGAYLARQRECGKCTPTLRLATELSADGQPIEAFAILVHDEARCPVRSELVTTRLKQQPA